MMRSLSNKAIGTRFERIFVEYLRNKGYWVHFIVPDNRGAQPFDVIAVKNGKAYAYDCKTSSKRVFSIDRLEQNQILAFDRWMACGNNVPRLAVLYENRIYIVNYRILCEQERINLLKEDYAICIADLTENQN